MVTRSQDLFREELRKSIQRDLFTDARIMDTKMLLHSVDEDLITKMRLSTYGQMEGLTKHMINRTEDQEQMEKARSATVSTNTLNNRADAREVPLEKSEQEMYFNYYGHGANDSPVPDPPNGTYTCPCGNRYMMSWRFLPLECTRCRRITPIGEMVRDGVLKR